MPTPCTDQEFEADSIAVAVIGDVGRWRAVVHMAGQLIRAQTPGQVRGAWMLLRATIARATR